MTTAARTKWVRLLSCASAVLLGIVVYLNALQNPFVYDDFRTVVDNGSIASLRDLPTIVAHEVTRPLTNFSLAVDRAIWGTTPFGFHLTNVLLHALNIALVFALVGRAWREFRTQEPRPDDAGAIAVATMAALLFAVHPLMTEAVGYISSRSDLLCAALFLSAFLAALNWLRSRGPWRMLLVWLLWGAALLSKEMAAVFPIVVWCWVALSAAARDDQPQSPWKLLGPMLGLMTFGAVIRVAVFAGYEGGRVNWDGWPAAGLTLIAIWEYARLIFLPAGQTIFHAPNPVQSLTDIRLWLAIVPLVTIAVASWKYRRHVAAAAFGWCWFVLLLAPSVLLGATEGRGVVTEHRAYLPAAGLLLAVAALLGSLASITSRFRSSRILAPMAFASIVLMFSGHTYLRNIVWSDPVNLWQEASAYAPESWLPFAVLGESLHAEARHAEAADAYRRSLALRPDNESATMNLVVCLSELRRDTEASEVVTALERLKPASPYVPIGRGTIEAIKGRPREARALFLAALGRDPSNVIARQWLAVLAEDADDKAEALHRCYELQRLTPGRTSIDDCIARSKPAQ